ncbi:MAG: ribonuclease H-like domain-containing protein [Solirubrobacteraceae bacterium]
MRRYDVSAVRPQGGYVAKQCPVRAQNDALRPCEPLAPSPELQRRFDQGRAFEDGAVANLEAVAADVVVTTAETEEELEACTAEAVENDVSIIVGGRLPTDVEGRRVGKPDLLVAAGDGAYRPVDVKHHMALEPKDGDGRGLPALCSELARPLLEEAAVDDRFCARKREEDLLQLAHYQRMLEAAGLAAAEGRWGGIVGTERRIVWYDLDAPIWKTPSSDGRQKMRSTMDRYDFEFDFRLDVISVAHAHLQDGTVPLLVEPAAIDECPECPWRDYCRARLESGSGDVSLLPRIGWRQRAIHVAHGVRNRAELARLDIRTAQLVAQGVNVPELQSLIADLPPETPVGELASVVRSKKALATLDAAGVRTFGELEALPRSTASYAGSGMGTLPGQIDLARAALAPAPVYARRGVDALSVPRANIEVDVDMESIEQGVYLWGVLLLDRTKQGATPEYRAFATWERLEPDVELENSLRFWAWLSGVRADAAREGLSFRAYCYNAAAENTYLRRLGLAGGIMDEVTAFIASTEWVDLLKVVDSQLLTGAGLGLKKVAPLAGFSWSVDGAGGDASMLRYDVAVGRADAQGRENARDWLLTYNRGDVEATLAIRDWLEREGALIPRVDSLDAAFAHDGGRSVLGVAGQ